MAFGGFGNLTVVRTRRPRTSCHPIASVEAGVPGGGAQLMLDKDVSLMVTEDGKPAGMIGFDFVASIARG
jgi:hypothetical protein